ncbi:hypothetical protein D9613_000859 [Agrocybe pediades]|uniref:Uncharacterized protein n=1 Tax=Agrocybe pediades TaxID=84607 RepID=A0A8H4QZZ1_9AGAR|nr:hypothetical protein D9613_000859 [Agrocybe pediades]
MSSEPQGRFAAYRSSLTKISARTGAPLPSLVLSFGILHELTAVVPLVGFFYGARALGVGERVISMITDDDKLGTQSDDGSVASKGSGQMSWARQKMKTWVEEGDRWAIRIGRRYGVFGYEKREPGVKDNVEEMAHVSGHLAGDVANAVLAYGMTKALLPLRIGASIYLSPMFSRRVIEPIRKTIIQPFRRSS